MNQIPKRDKYAEEIARIREIVGRHALPEFVTGFDVRLGEFDGDPAMWITFHTTGLSGKVGSSVIARAEALSALRKAVHADLLDAIEDRYPYYRFQPAPSIQPAQH